jgi:hypothetical protein
LGREGAGGLQDLALTDAARRPCARPLDEDGPEAHPRARYREDDRATRVRGEGGGKTSGEGKGEGGEEATEVGGGEGRWQEEEEKNRVRSEEEETDTKRTKVQESQVVAFKPDKKLATLIEADVLNQHNWAEVMAECPKGRPKFVDCVCCQDVVVNPVTTECKHNTCRDCLKRSVGVSTCPVCRHELNRADAETVNKDLKAILNILLPGYEL